MHRRAAHAALAAATIGPGEEGVGPLSGFRMRKYSTSVTNGSAWNQSREIPQTELQPRACADAKA